MDEPMPCRLCLDDVPEGDDLAARIREFVLALPEPQRVSRAVYERRLARCGECRYLSGYTCLRCGCYVQIRAAKSAMDCPLPGGSGWH